MKSRLFVGGLSDEVVEQDLRILFGRLGEVASISLIADRETGRSRGFAFVQMATEEAAVQAMEQLHGAELCGKRIRVVEAKTRAEAQAEIQARAALRPPTESQIELVAQLEDLDEPVAPVITGFEAVRPMTTTERIRYTAPARTARKLALIGGTVVLLLGALALGYFLTRDTTPAADPRAVLVVPMEVVGQSEEAEYLGYAFAQAVAVNLAPGRNFRVLPVPNSDDVTAGGAQDHAKLARSQGAGRLLVGTLTRSADVVRANLTLVDANENSILWGTQKEGRDSEILGLAAEFAREVAAVLDVSFPRLHVYITDLTGDPQMAAAPETAETIGALRRGELKAALDATERLVQSFADQPAALALRSHALVMRWDAEPSAENLEAIHQSLAALDRTGQGYPYNAFYRAYLRFFHERRAADAIKQYTQLLERGDLAPAARAWMLRYRAVIKQQTGEVQGALDDLGESLRLDPTNAWTLGILSGALVDAGEAEQGLRRARQALALVPSYWRSHQALGYGLAAMGRQEDAAKAYGRACELSSAQLPCSLHALTLKKIGRDDEARAAAERAKTLVDTAWGIYNLACHWALAGDRTQALSYLERAVSLGLADATVLQDSDLDALRDDPTYRRLMAKVQQRLPQR